MKWRVFKTAQGSWIAMSPECPRDCKCMVYSSWGAALEHAAQIGSTFAREWINGRVTS